MRPLFNFTTYNSIDLTECKIHCLVDERGKRRIVAMVPKVWEKIECPPVLVTGFDGEPVEMEVHNISQWEEIVLFEET